MTAELALPQTDQHSIAIVGLACLFPDASDPAALLDVVLTRRRAFRRIPRCRLDLADYYSPDRSAPDATYSTRAALIEGWRFDPATFGGSGRADADADPAHWIALDTAGRALAAAGLRDGTGLPVATTGAYIGSTGSPDRSPAGWRLRWPYSRRVIAEALSAAAVSADVADRVLDAAAARYLAPFPPVTTSALRAITPTPIATGICNQFALGGGGVIVDAAGASSLAATASACLALAAGEVDAAVAGGVDLCIDPVHLVRLAKSGLLAIGDMRLYDEDPTGFLPGEGCGIVVLMRSTDARAARLPVYAEIVGWGVASGSRPGAGPDPAGRGLAGQDPAAQVLAMRRAYAMAGVDPADVQLIEGCGTGIPAVDDAELAALAELRTGSRRLAAFGSISANIGNTRAAAGAAGLIKAVLAISTGVLPPSTGVRTPHPILRDGQAALCLPTAPMLWPAGVRHAGVSAADAEGLAVHLVLRGDADRSTAIAGAPQPSARAEEHGTETASAAGARSRRQMWVRRRTAPPQDRSATEPAADLAVTHSVGTYADVPEHPFAYLLHAADEPSMIAILTQIAAIAPWLSDAQLQDLAVGLSRSAPDAGSALRIALTASSQDELAGLASEAMRLLPALTGSALGTLPGIYLGRQTGSQARDANDVALLIAGQPDDVPDLPQRQLSRMVAVLRWLDDLGVEPSVAVGHGIGELAGLVWAGAATPADARTLTAMRSAALSAPAESAPGQLGETIRRLSNFTFRPPQRRLISGSTGRDVGGPSEIAETLCAELFEARLAACDTDPAARPARSATPTRSDIKEAEQAASVHARNPLAAAIAAACAGARLLVLTGVDQNVATAVAALGAHHCDRTGADSSRSTVIIDGDPADDGSVAHAAAALFAAGVLARPGALYADRPSRPFDIWREQIFVTHPYGAPAHPDAPQPTPDAAAGNDVKGEDGQRAEPDVAPPEPTDRKVPADTAADSTVQAADGSAERQDHAITAVEDTAQAADSSAQRQVQPAIAAEDTAQAADRSVDGVAPWIRCYVERQQPAEPPVSAPDGQRWRLHTGGCEPLRQRAYELFTHDPEANRTLAVIGGLDDAAAREAAVLAARDAIGTGRLIAICAGPGPAGLWATLRAEHPSLGITVVRAPMTEDGLRAASHFAAAEPGAYRELSVDPDGTAFEPVSTILPEPGGGQFPFGTGDVVLVSRGSGAAALMLAQVLACSGAAIAVMGRDHPQRDDAVVAGLEELRSAGAKISYELLDLDDHAALVAAVRRVEARFGRVTAIGHSAGPGQPRALAELTPAEVEEQVLRHTYPLDRLAAAARTAARGGERSGRLRLIVTSGSVIGRYGMAGESAGALVTGALADLAQRLAAASPGCRALHVDWPAWAGSNLGERVDLADRMQQAGFMPMQVADGSRQLLKLLATEGLPARVAVHGRVGAPAPRSIAAAGPTALGSATDSQPVDPASTRFVERMVVHYPGVELVAEAKLSLVTDPYLGDYRIDGVPVLPPVMALEAMAQAASVLAGAPARRIAAVNISAPIVLPAGTPGSQTVIRLAALREGDAVTVTLRSDNSGFAVEHGRAVFGVAGPEPLGGGEPADARRPAKATDPGEPGRESVGGAELYGSVFFQDGRFRRLATVRPAGPPGSRGATGLADGADELPWFGAVPPGRDGSRQRLVLGSAGLSDATLQLVQACVPDRRLAFEGCDQVTFWPNEATGPVTVRAVRAERAERVPSPRRAAGGDAAQDASRRTNAEWNVDAIDSAGRALIAWRGLRMRDAGPLPQRARREESDRQSGSLRDKGAASYHRSELTAST